MKQIKEILKIGVPIMLGQACVIIVAFADNIMIGWHNVDELAAASFVNNVLNLVILMGLGFSTGLTPMIGAFNGVNDVKSIGSTMKNGILVNGVIGLASLVVLSVIYCFLDRFGQAPELLPLIRPCLSSWAFRRFSNWASTCSSSLPTVCANQWCRWCF